MTGYVEEAASVALRMQSPTDKVVFLVSWPEASAKLVLKKMMNSVANSTA